MWPESLVFFRLVVIWREVYKRALLYQEELHHHRGVKYDLEKMSVIISHIQQALQSAGDRLEQSHTLRSFSGEHEQPNQKHLLVPRCYYNTVLLMLQVNSSLF